MTTIALVALIVAGGGDISLDEFAARRQALAEVIGDDSIAVLFGAEGSGEAPFVQEDNFLYLTGLDQPDAILVITPGDERRSETLYLPRRNRSRERWVGPFFGPGDTDAATGVPDPERQETLDATGVGAVRPIEDFDRDLRGAVGRGKTLWMATRPGPLDEPLSRGLDLIRDLRDRYLDLETAALRPVLRSLRVIKSEAEVDAIRRATAITLEAEREVAAMLEPGLHEYEVKARLEYVFARAGSKRLAFPSVVGSGPNSTVLHYQDDRRRIENGDLVLVDIGASWNSYASDVTRTFPASGRFSARQREIYEIVLAAQAAAIAAVKPGARLRGDVHAAARAVIEEAGYGRQFLHSTSHYVGLAVHDVGLRDGELEAGMVITVEPGIYLVDEALGVRIEDIVLVTEDGYELLTRALPAGVDEIEAMMSNRVAPRDFGDHDDY